MIIIYSTNKNYILNKFYIDLLINKYHLIKLNIINDNMLYNKKIYDEGNTNIYLGDINETLFILLSNIHKNFYLLNTNILSSYHDYSYINNYPIKIIDKSFINITILKKYKEVLYLPCQVCDTYIFNYEKKNNIIIFNKKTEYIKNLCNNIHHEITDLSTMKENKFKIIAQHKILLLFNDNTEYYNEILYQYCIYNKVIIINDKKLSSYNDFLKSYVIDVEYDLIPSYIDYILNNYDEVYNNTYNNFNLDYIKENVREISDYTIYKNIINDTIGFIILRHVDSETTGKYWIESYNCIRKFYYNKIIIIDDNSNYDYIENITLINCEIIQSEFLGKGEILPYYYLYKYKFFKKAIILHDSVFIHKYIHFNDFNNIKFIWHFTHHWNNESDEIKLLDILDNNQALKEFYYNKEKWVGCFGVQSIIEYTFLEKIVNKYNIFKLIDYIQNRELRMNFERIFGLICFYEYDNLINNISLYGIIHHYIHWGYLYSSYIEDKNNKKIDHLDIIKVWSGR